MLKIVSLAWAATVAGSCSKGGDSGGRVEYAYGEVGISPGQLAFPRAIVAESEADGACLWVVDKRARLQRLRASDGACLDLWQMPKWEEGKPVGLCVWNGSSKLGGDVPGEGIAVGRPLLIVADTHYHRVMIYDIAAGSKAITEGRKTPEAGGSFGSMGKGHGEFIFVTDIAVLPTDDGKGIRRLYVGEYGENDRISIYEPKAGADPRSLEFEFKGSFGKWGNGDSANDINFNRPQGLEIDLDRKELLVADAGNHRIGRFTYEGKLIKWFGGQELGGTEPGRFSYPYGILSLHDGTALVCENGSGRVQRIDLETGASKGIWDKTPEGRPMATPWGLARVGGMVYVLDSGNNRVMRFPVPKG